MQRTFGIGVSNGTRLKMELDLYRASTAEAYNKAHPDAPPVTEAQVNTLHLAIVEVGGYIHGAVIMEVPDPQP